jgi:hypothetical protein
VRVRQFELRLLAVALTVLWAAGGGIVLIAYRPGGPIDLLVGIAASLPLLVSVAAIVWPPLVRSDPESAGIFWIGIIAALLLLPSVGAVAGQVLQGGAIPLVPSTEIIYPWSMALFATSLFTGLGITRQLIPEVGIGRRRLAASIAFAVVATGVIGGVFGAVSLADDAALREKPAAYSRYGPTDGKLTPPDCTGPIVTARSGSVAVDFWGDVDQRAVGTVSLSGRRSGSDFTSTAQVVSRDLFGQYETVRIGSLAWTKTPEQDWTETPAASLSSTQLDLAVLAGALSKQNRATAENHGLEYVEGARARRCRILVDGPTFAATFPQACWLIGDASMATWRGQIDFWVFGDGEIGRISGSVNGNAQDILPHGLLATVTVRFNMIDRDQPVTITPPRT